MGSLQLGRQFSLKRNDTQQFDQCECDCLNRRDVPNDFIQPDVYNSVFIISTYDNEQDKTS